MLEKKAMIDRMNVLSSGNIPFLFITNAFATGGYVLTEDEIDESFIRFGISNEIKTDQQKLTHPQVTFPLNFEKIPVSFSIYQQKFDKVMNEIHQGNTFLINLTQPTSISTDVDLLTIYQKSNAAYKLWIQNQFVVFSPETFVKIYGGRISTFPMKGTIDASVPDAANIILHDKKEMAEHATIVDLLRNDLSMVADNVQITRYRYVETVKTNPGELLQVSSEISGELPADYHAKIGDIIFRMLPAGSVTGAPKPKTVEIIKRVENYERGFYTGVFGWFDGENLDSAVMIRYVEQTPEGLVFKSGGGITYQSEAEKEYQELIQKVYVPVY